MPAAILIFAIAAVESPQDSEQFPDANPVEIVVTGERVRRTLNDTPSSVTVVTQSEIEATGADRVDDILALIPNIQLGNGSQGPAIRGLDSTGPLAALPAFLGGNRPRTTIIVDGRPVTYNELVFGTFAVWDVERIEVFRSPQTTTQGQNSIAGAIFVNTNEPRSVPEYRARGILGNYKMRQISALTSGPVAGDDIAFRVAGDFRYSKTTSHIRDNMEGADPNHDVYGLLRAKLLIDPLPATRAVITYAHNQSQSPQDVGLTAPFRERRDESGGYGIFRINVDSLTAAITHDAGSDLNARILLTGGDSDVRRLAPRGLGQTEIGGHDWSAEAILEWSPDGRVTAVGGVSHTRIALKQFIDLSRLSGSIGRFRDWQDATGIFADAQIALSSRAKMTVGIRYQHDRQKRQGELAADTFSIPVDFVGKFSAWLPKLTFAYDLTSDVRAGAMVQKAYNPGGTTIRVDTGRPDDFEAEALWDYEAYVRADLAEGRATATANIFYYDMHNAQRSKGILIRTPSGDGVGFANLFNVPRARTYGAEGQLNWHANEKLSATLSIGLLGSKIMKTDLESADWEGNEFDRAPHFSGAAAIDWRPSDRLHLTAQVRHHSGYFSEPDNATETRVDAGTAVNARAEYMFGAITVFAQVQNVFDTLNMLALGDPDPFTGRPQAGEAEDPRLAAIGLDARF